MRIFILKHCFLALLFVGTTANYGISERKGFQGRIFALLYDAASMIR